MKIAIINTFDCGSTGTIASFIGNYAENKGHKVKYFYGRSKSKTSHWTFIGENKFFLRLSNALTYVTGNVGSFHHLSTTKLIRKLKEFRPDVIHLHNIHGNYLNFKMLFSYLATFQGKIVFTLHDEFLLTGRCALCFCDKWRDGCVKCEHLHAYPHVMLDKCNVLQNKKIESLKKIRNVEIITPSKWLNGLVESSKISFLKHRCIYNGLDSPLLEEFSLDKIIDSNKINILFAAHTWSENKGALIIKELAKMLDKDKYNLIIAGYDKYCDKWFDFECRKFGLLKRERMLYLLKNVDIFINPTFKDNLPTILIESLQVGTPAITFDTGGCNEIIDESCGVVTGEKTASAILDAINKFDFSKRWDEACKTKANNFDVSKTLPEYIKAFE